MSIRITVPSPATTPGLPTPLQLSINTTNAATELINNSYLTYLVPSETNIDLEKALEGFDGSKPINELIEQRDTLFFDETVDVLLVLKTPWLPRKELDYHLSRISISLEAQVANGSLPGRESPSASESIFSGRLQETKNPFIVEDEDKYESGAEEEEEEEPPRHVYAMWKMPVLLLRPRMRLHSPSVVFSASASLDPDLWTEPIAPDVGYLTSGMPSGLNLLESFGSDSALNGVKPRLSALRVSRVAPVTRQQDFMTRLRTLPQLSIKIFPVLHTRIRFSRPSTIPLSATIVALLEIDFTSHFNCEALLNDIKLSTPNGVVENLNDAAGLSLPLSCVSHDHITFLYHIKPKQTEAHIPRDTSGNLEISISAAVHVVPGVCTPSLGMSWTTAIDFSLPVNPSFGTASESGIQRAHRPTQLSIGSVAQAINHLKSPSAIRPDALPSLEASTNRTEATIPDLGITMSFTAPSHAVHPGDIFSWTVYVVNRTSSERGSNRPPRKLALVAVPKRRRNEVRPIRPPSSHGRRRGEKEVADAVLDENVLHALQKNAVVESTELICLSADTRVGPVAPGACHVAELQFLALREGIVGLEAIRVVDLGSQEHVDIRDLPTMIVEPIAAAA
ncbi:TRAPP trafficking subunit Trs65 domain-containing protein [Trichoderma austrokoningii]